MATVAVAASTQTDAADKVLRLTLPKFSKGYDYADFLSVILPLVRPEHITLGRLRYSNEWLLTVESIESRNKLLSKGVITIRGKRCILSPFGSNTVCGKIHWLPTAVEDSPILEVLKRFGDVAYFSYAELTTETEIIRTSIRFFILSLKSDVTKDDVPHYIKVGDTEGLVVIKGREPICFGCKKFGHFKAFCPDSAPEGKVLLGNKRRFTASEKWRKLQHAKASANNQVKSDDTTKASGTSGPSDGESCTDSQTKGNLLGLTTDVNVLTEIVGLFGQKLADVLHKEMGVAPDASTSKSKKKKKKKKSKSVSSADKDEPKASNEAVIGLLSPEVHPENESGQISMKSSSRSPTGSQNSGSASEGGGQSSKKKNKSKKKPAVIPELAA